MAPQERDDKLSEIMVEYLGRLQKENFELALGNITRSKTGRPPQREEIAHGRTLVGLGV